MNVLFEDANIRIEHHPLDRVLVGEGSLVICAFNPWSTWGVRHHFAASAQFPPHAARMMSEHRTRDWLGLLGFEVVSSRSYLFAPPWTQSMFGLREWVVAARQKPAAA